MKIILHIGAPRTGTTSLQAMLTKNRGLLKRQGVCYPDVAGIGEQSKAQHNLAFTLMPKYPSFVGESGRMTRDEAWAQLQNVLAQSDCPVMILSSETFSGVPVEEVRFIKNQLSGHEVIPIYVRRSKDDWQRSMWEQQIKRHPYRKTLFKGAADRDIAEVHLSNWMPVFDVKVIPYSKTAHAEVLAVAGVDIEKLETVPRENSKLSPRILDLMVRMNRIDMPEKYHAQVNRVIERWNQESDETE